MHQCFEFANNAYYTKKEEMLLEELISEKKLSKIIIDASDLN